MLARTHSATTTRMGDSAASAAALTLKVIHKTDSVFFGSGHCNGEECFCAIINYFILLYGRMILSDSIQNRNVCQFCWIKNEW